MIHSQILPLPVLGRSEKISPNILSHPPLHRHVCGPRLCRVIGRRKLTCERSGNTRRAPTNIGRVKKPREMSEKGRESVCVCVCARVRWWKESSKYKKKKEREKGKYGWKKINIEGYDTFYLIRHIYIYFSWIRSHLKSRAFFVQQLVASNRDPQIGKPKGKLV